MLFFLLKTKVYNGWNQKKKIHDQQWNYKEMPVVSGLKGVTLDV